MVPLEDEDSDDDDEALGDQKDDKSDFDVYERDHEISFSPFKRVSCFTHALQLVVHQFDQESTFKDVISCAQRLVSKASYSSKGTEKLISLRRKNLFFLVPPGGAQRF